MHVFCKGRESVLVLKGDGDVVGGGGLRGYEVVVCRVVLFLYVTNFVCLFMRGEGGLVRRRVIY